MSTSAIEPFLHLLSTTTHDVDIIVVSVLCLMDNIYLAKQYLKPKNDALRNFAYDFNYA